jgi:hypothetical protein
LPRRLCSLIARWVQENQNYRELKESIKQKTHTNTQKERRRREVPLGKPQRQLPDEKSHQEAANPSRPKTEEHDTTAGGT